MKSRLFLLPFVGGSFAATIPAFYGSGNAPQLTLDGGAFDASPSTANAISLNLDEVRLVQMEGKEPVYMTELEMLEAKAKGINFFDITDTPDLESFSRLKPQATVTYTPPSSYDQVTAVIQTLSTAGPRENLEKLTSFETRYYRSESGKKSQKWLLAKINQITEENASPEMWPYISVEEFEHEWGQNTIIARINGSSTDDRIVILGAHQDSINMWPWLPAPGADDDGSGSVTILESYRALLASGFAPERPVEFHWYSAEEAGLLGSQAVARDYAARGLRVYGMSQFDMTAWVRKGTREEVGVIVDHVDPSLTKFNKQLIDNYLSIPYVETKCGYACSDHASWSKAGYPSIFTIESAFENANHGNIHSSTDRIDISPEFSFDHMLEFSKLAVAYAIELSKI